MCGLTARADPPNSCCGVLRRRCQAIPAVTELHNPHLVRVYVQDLDDCVSYANLVYAQCQHLGNTNADLVKQTKSADSRKSVLSPSHRASSHSTG